MTNIWKSLEKSTDETIRRKKNKDDPDLLI